MDKKKEMNYDKIIHLSHNDLDGYGCQYLTNLLGKNISYLNTSYFDVSKNTNLVFKKLLENKSEKTLFLITDVNIDDFTANKINNFRTGNKNLNYDVLVIDHHKTGFDVSQKNLDWYKLDTTRCATYLVGDWLLENFEFENKTKEHIKFVQEFVDSHDRWIEDHKFHTKANLVSDYIFTKIDYPLLLESFKRDNLFYFLKESFNFFSNEENTIFDFENNQIVTLLGYLKDKIPNEIFENKNIAFDHKLYKYFTLLYSDLETDTYVIKYDDNTNYKFKLFYELNSNVFQYLTHYYLDENSDKIDFMINVKRKGACSFRSKNEIDVGTLALQYFNGGGHTNASGGSLDCVFKIESEVIEYLKTNFQVINLNDIVNENIIDRD